MNYGALTVDELAAMCVIDSAARKYAGEHLAELLERQREEWLEEQEISNHDPWGLDHALTWDHDNIPHDSMWWRI